MRIANALLALSAATCLMAGAAQAGVVISSGPAWGGPTQQTGVCYYSNVGTTSITFTSSVMKDEAGNTSAINQQTCSAGTGILAPGKTCRTVVLGLGNSPYWCTAIVSAKATLRGRMEVRTSTNVLLTSQPIE